MLLYWITGIRPGPKSEDAMNYIVFAIIGLFTLVGAIVGWRRATERIENPPGKYDFPGGMSRRDHLRILARKHRQWRIPITLAYGIGRLRVADGLCGFRPAMTRRDSDRP